MFSVKTWTGCILLTCLKFLLSKSYIAITFDMVVSPSPALELEGQSAEHVFLTVNTDTELRDVCRMSAEDRVRLNVTEVLLTETIQCWTM